MRLRDLAPELLIEILKKLDLKSLRQLCWASSRVRTTVKGHTEMYYKLELELTGMKDGPALNATISVRRDKLLDFKKAFPTLGCLPRLRFEIPLPRPDESSLGRVSFPPLFGVSGGFFYHTRMDNSKPRFVVGLHELPCPRVHPAREFRSLPTFSVPYLPQSVTVDVTQSLLVTSKISRFDEFCRIVLFFRRLVEDPSHQQAVWREVEFVLELSDEEDCVAIDHVHICGRMVGMTVNQITPMGRTSKLCIVDWKTGKKVMWRSDVLSFQFLDETRMLVVRPVEDDDVPSCPSIPGRLSMLEVHSLATLGDSEEAVDCAYQLPPGTFVIRPNISALSESGIPPGIMFHPDPARRIIVLERKEPHTRLIVLHESSLETIPREQGGYGSIPWGEWPQDCLIRDIPYADSSSLQVVGGRIFYLEVVPNSKHAADSNRRRIHLLDFNPHALECIECGMQDIAPVRLGKVKTRVYPDCKLPFIHSQTNYEIDISNFFATEDNIILVNCGETKALVDVLTFDTPRLAPSAD